MVSLKVPKGYEEAKRKYLEKTHARELAEEHLKDEVRKVKGYIS